MRSTASGLITLALLAGCGGKHAPQPAVLTGWDRTQAFAEDQPSTVQYSGHAMVATPVVPVLPFGSAFDLAVVVEAKKTGVSHYQFARTAGPDGPRWVAIETDEATGDQTVISNLETLDAWAPEMPIRRQVDPAFKVVDRSTNDELDITISYTNADNEEIEAHLLGDPPHRFQKRRNADTEGALRNQALLLVDLPHRESLFKASIKRNGRGVTVAKAGGFVPLQLATEMVTGGLATGNFTTVPEGEPRPLESDWRTPEIIPPEPEEPEEPPAEAPPEEPDPLHQAMEANKAAFDACYATAAEANAEIEGRILLAWKVAEGATSEVSVVLDTAGDEALSACLVEAVGAMVFEGMEGDLGFPFTIVKGEGVVLGEQDEAEEEGARTVSAPRGGGDEAEDGAVRAPRGGTDGEPAAEGEAATEGEGAAEDEGAAEEGAEAEAAEGGADEGGADEALDDGEDLLADDPDAVSAPRTPQVIYNGLSDFVSRHTMGSGNKVELQWKVENTGDRVIVRQVSPERTLQYEYLVNYDSIELSDIAVYQTGRPVPVVHVDINPAIPDLRRPFSGRAESRYVIDVNGQGGYGSGRVEAWWSEGGPKVKFIPDAPDWTTDGNLLTTIVYRAGGSDIAVRKTGE